MKPEKLIEKVYLEATKGLREEWITADQPYWYHYVSNLKLPLQVTYLIVAFDSQMTNGGLHKYFANGYGKFVKETIEALLEIDAYKKSGLLDRALSIVKKENITDEQFRKELMNKTHHRLFEEDLLFKCIEKLDDRYYRIEDEDLMVLLEGFLSREFPKS